jgi:hypothetical protein
MFVGSRDPFDVWFKEQMLAAAGVDLNNPPADIKPAELLSIRPRRRPPSDG